MRKIELESQLEFRESELQQLNQKYSKLLKDFNYNLKLIDSRDSELNELEDKHQELLQNCKSQKKDISRLRTLLSEAQEKSQKDCCRIKDLESQVKEIKTHYQHKLETISRNQKYLHQDQSQLLREQKLYCNSLLGQVLKKVHHLKLDWNRGNFTSQVSQLRSYCFREVQKLSSEFTQTINQLKANHSRQLADLRSSFEYKITLLNEEINQRDKLQQELLQKNQSLSEKLTCSNLGESEKALQLENDLLKTEIQKLRSNYDDELKFVKEETEIQKERLKTAHQNQVDRLKSRLKESEEDLEKAYNQLKLQREKLSQEPVIIQQGPSKDQVSKLESEIHELKNKLWEKEDALGSLQVEHQQLKLEKEQNLRREQNSQKLFSEDLGFASPVRSYLSNSLEKENQELKDIISQMRQDMEEIAKEPPELQSLRQENAQLQEK